MSPKDSQQLPALTELRDQFVSIARSEQERNPRSGSRRTVLAVVAAAALALPAGFAIAQVTDGDSGVPASQCPEANAALERSGLPVPDEYAPDCPTAEQINRAQDEGIQTAPPPALLKALEEGRIHEGQDPATYPPDVKGAIREWEAQHGGGG